MNALDNMGEYWMSFLPGNQVGRPTSSSEVKGEVSLMADARRHMNRLCQAAGVPLMESGTSGYLGQVAPIVRVSLMKPFFREADEKDHTECFDCVPKPTPKSFPVCTIRSTPSEPIHCIVWAKSYLFGYV